MTKTSAYVFLILGTLVIDSCAQTGEKRPPKVAIIGGGIGGASVAYFLSQRLPGVDVTVFEKARVGGRLDTVDIAGRRYEVGGSIIHSANKLMVDYLEICNLTIKEGKGDEGGGNGAFSLIKEGEVVWHESENFYLNSIRMIWRYGLFSLLKLNRFVSNLLTSFATIYPKLEEGVGFSNVKELLEGMGGDMAELTRVTIGQRLEELGVSRELVGELGTVASRVNYGQFPSTLHGFVGAVGLAGVDGNLWAVEGGNFRVAECALEKSGAALRISRVEEVKPEPHGGFIVRHTELKSDATEKVLRKEGGFEQEGSHQGSCVDCVEEEFDVVVVAAPQTRDKTKLTGLNNQIFPGHYHRTVATIVHGDLILEALKSSTRINFFLSPSSAIVSISPLTPVDLREGEPLPSVYKIFSSKLLSKEDLEELFKPLHSYQVVDWLAYPEYTLGDDLNSFVLTPGLYYTSRIEWAASAMEMSVLAASNVANLVKNDWIGKKVDIAGHNKEEL